MDRSKIGFPKKCGLNCFRKYLKKTYFSGSQKSIPKWLVLTQKIGILTIKGVAPLEDEDRNYKILVKGPKEKNIFVFWLIINSSENNLNRNRRESVFMSTSLVKSRYGGSKDRTKLFKENEKFDLSDKSKQFHSKNKTVNFDVIEKKGKEN